MNKRTSFSLIFFFLILSFSALRAQPPGVTKYETYFEGKIDYKFSTSGKDAEMILRNNAIDKMSTIIKDGDFIIHIYGTQPEKQQRRTDHFNSENGTAPPAAIDEVQIIPTTRLYINDSNRVYVIDAANERAFESEKRSRKKPSKFPEAFPTKDSLKILGVWTYAYKCEYDGEQITYYISPNYRVNMGFYKGKTKSRAAWLTKGLNGCIPLKTIRRTPNYTIETVATKITPMKLKSHEFRIPPHFKILPYDYRR